MIAIFTKIGLTGLIFGILGMFLVLACIDFPPQKVQWTILGMFFGGISLALAALVLTLICMVWGIS